MNPTTVAERQAAQYAAVQAELDAARAGKKVLRCARCECELARMQREADSQDLVARTWRALVQTLKGTQ